MNNKQWIVLCTVAMAAGLAQAAHGRDDLVIDRLHR